MRTSQLAKPRLESTGSMDAVSPPVHRPRCPQGVAHTPGSGCHQAQLGRPNQPGATCVKVIDGRSRSGSGGRCVSIGKLTGCLVVGLLATAACPLSGASAATSSQRTRSYLLPSDRWKPGQAAMQALSSGPFNAALTPSGPCTSSASIDYLWPGVPGPIPSDPVA